MHRNTLKQLLTNYQPSDSSEIIAKKDMLIFLESYPDWFERSCMPGHFTASAWLLNQAGNKALLMYHAKLQLWVQLGGHCDGNFDPLQVALKEAQEESGIENIIAVSPEIFDLDIHKIPARKDELEHLHYDVRFLLQVASDEQLMANHESEELVWFDRDKSKLPTSERSVVRMFDKTTSLIWS